MDFHFIDVGHGDCIFCSYLKKQVYIDTGDGSKNINNVLFHVSHCHDLDIYLSHNHKDHIGGVCEIIKKFYALQNKKSEEVSQRVHLFLPLYFNENTLLIDMVTTLFGKKSVLIKQDIIKDLFDSKNEINKIITIIDNIVKNKSDFVTVSIICNENKLDDGFICLLPNRRSNFAPLGSLPQTTLGWVASFCTKKENSSAANFLRGFIDNNVEAQYKFSINPRDYFQMDFYYISNFISQNYFLLSQCLYNPKIQFCIELCNSLNDYIHDNCMVLKYQMKGEPTILFTGDISYNSFKKINSVDSKCDIIKISHHGSAKNNKNDMFNDIFNSKEKGVAIISHGNRKFGRSRDSLPNSSVIDLLNKLNINIYPTQNVYKNQKAIINMKNEIQEYKNVKVEDTEYLNEYIKGMIKFLSNIGEMNLELLK